MTANYLSNKKYKQLLFVDMSKWIIVSTDLKRTINICRQTTVMGWKSIIEIDDAGWYSITHFTKCFPFDC